MPDLKVLIGGRNYNISCNPGEEIAASESASLLDKEAQLIQDQLGRLPEEKMLLLSGLLLGDKIRSLKEENSALEETLRVTQSELNDISSSVNKTEIINASGSITKEEDLINNNKTDQMISLQGISDLLDTVIQDLEGLSSNETRQKESNPEDHNGQKSFL
tara:strand:+ start:173 stop:655 length:483 start_codon:yes stop_codon:yes gene_type:complete